MVAGDDADDAPKTDLSNCDTVELRGEAQCSAVSEVQCSSAVQVDGFRSICLSHAQLIVHTYIHTAVPSISRRTYSSVRSVRSVNSVSSRVESSRVGRTLSLDISYLLFLTFPYLL